MLAWKQKVDDFFAGKLALRNNVMIPFVLNTSKGLNKIASAYGREKASGQPNDLWYINQLNQKNLLHINKNRTARWVATRTGAAGSHNAPLTKQSFSTISIADENDLSKLKKENPGFYQSSSEAVLFAREEIKKEMPVCVGIQVSPAAPCKRAATTPYPLVNLLEVTPRPCLQVTPAGQLMLPTA